MGSDLLWTKATLIQRQIAQASTLRKFIVSQLDKVPSLSASYTFTISKRKLCYLSLAKFPRSANKPSRQANYARNWNKKCGILYFSTSFNKSHLVLFNIIMYFCQCQNMLSCIFEHVMQFKYFHIRVHNIHYL